MSASVAARLRAQYEADGFCVSEPLVDRATLMEARSAVAAVMAGHYETGEPPIYRNWSLGDLPKSVIKIDLPHLCNRTLQRLTSDWRIGLWVAEVLCAEFVQMWACELIYKLPEAHDEPDRQGIIGWHQDDRFWDHWDGEVFTLWLALVDVDEQMGPVRYVSGSHRWGSQEKAGFFFQTNLNEQRGLIGTPTGHAWREAPATLPAGAVSMHHRLTLHASEPNRSAGPRIGIAMHMRTERARMVPTPEPPFHSPDLLDPFACPVLLGTAQTESV